jgi:WD40 repeat protein
VQSEIKNFDQDNLSWIANVQGNMLICIGLFSVFFLFVGSLDSEACIYALSYDISGSRLVTCEADKTIKMWKEDMSATPETHPLNFRPPKEYRRY